jgi:hypothetical protein
MAAKNTFISGRVPGFTLRNPDANYLYYIFILWQCNAHKAAAFDYLICTAPVEIGLHCMIYPGGMANKAQIGTH